MASLFGFANTGAKDEGGGFFLGFPSYWNVVAFYAGFFHRLYGPGVNAVILLLLALLTVLPVRFLYPNLAPRPWRVPVVAGAVLWLGAMLGLLRDYPGSAGNAGLGLPALSRLLHRAVAPAGQGAPARRPLTRITAPPCLRP